MTDSHKTNGPSAPSESGNLSHKEGLCAACFAPLADRIAPCPACGYNESTVDDGEWNRLKPGTVVHGRYVVGAPLGQGGFGITYLGLDMLLSVKLAIKEYFPSGVAIRNPSNRAVQSASEESDADYLKGMEKFIEEARTLARFENNPSIVSVRDFFEENGTAYMVMNHLEGRTLMAHIKERGGRLPFGEALSILSPLMDALDEVHASGLIHRDISPDNIFLTRFGQVKLLDFGASKTALALMEQRQHSIVLKKGYSPAEQYHGSRHLGPWSDVYGMAATFYRCIAGMVPPDALDRMEEDSLVPPSRAGGVLPEYAEAALLRALSLSSADRPQSMREFKEGLQGEIVFSAENAGGRQPSPEREKKRRTVRSVPSSEKRTPPLPKRTRSGFFSLLLFFLLILSLGAGSLLFLALNDLMERADAGDPSAQRSIGRVYEIVGFLGGTEKAFDWYLQSARQGDASAQFALGRMHAEGKTRPSDYAKAAEWYEKAAEQGHVRAQFMLGFLYENGRGVPRDEARAAAWYRKAAEQGDARAQFKTGLFSEEGRGVAQSDVQAAEWYRRAAEQGHTTSQIRLAGMYERGRGVPKDESFAAVWYGRAAEGGDASAQFIIGEMYENGRGVEFDLVEAARWYRNAADGGHVEARFRIGTFYTNGFGVQRNDAQAARWYRKAAGQGHAAAQFSLGWSYEFGRGVLRNEERAAAWYRRAAEQGHPLAGIALGRMLP